LTKPAASRLAAEIEQDLARNISHVHLLRTDIYINVYIYIN